MKQRRTCIRLVAPNTPCGQPLESNTSPEMAFADEVTRSTGGRAFAYSSQLCADHIYLDLRRYLKDRDPEDRNEDPAAPMSRVHGRQRR